MRLGVIGLIPSDFTLVDDALGQHILSLGFTGVAAHVSGDPFQAQPAAIDHLRDVLAANGLRLTQFWGWYLSILSEDGAVRAAGIRAAQEIVRLGARAGADMIGIRPTSMSPSGPWSPHPANYAPTTEDRLVHSLRDIAAASDEYGLPLALECHVTTPLYSAEVARRVMERVDSEWLKVNFDPVNLVSDHRTAYHTTELVRHVLATLGSSIAAAHIKDVTVDDDHVVHISETPPGTGLMDFDTFFTGFEALLPDGYALIEHLPPEQLPAAADFVRRKLRELGIPLRGKYD